MQIDVTPEMAKAGALELRNILNIFLEGKQLLPLEADFKYYSASIFDSMIKASSSTAEPICYLSEVFDDDGNSIGYVETGKFGEAFAVYPMAVSEVDRELCAAQGQPNLVRFTEDGDNQFVTISEITVPTQYDKEQILMALKYLHDCYINTDFLAVNALVHMYHDPDKIVVRGEDQYEN